MRHDADALRRYFAAGSWQASTDEFPLSGWALVDRVCALEPRFTIDAGCGYHPFKHRIPNCIGIDLVNPAADLICSIVDAPIKDGSIDVALALGSVNFGTVDDVVRDLRVLAGWLQPGGKLFMRANPGEPVADPEVEVFPWSRELVPTLGEAAGLVLASEIEEEKIVAPWGAAARRLFWTYGKP